MTKENNDLITKITVTIIKNQEQYKSTATKKNPQRNTTENGQNK